MTKRILFKCKGNICRSPAAEVILKTFRPDWVVLSCATTPNTAGQAFHPPMVTQLNRSHYAVANPFRPVIHEDELIECMHMFDEIHDLHAEGISDPYLTGDCQTTILEIMEYISTFILGEEDDGVSSDQ